MAFPPHVKVSWEEKNKGKSLKEENKDRSILEVGEKQVGLKKLLGGLCFLNCEFQESPCAPSPFGGWYP